MCIRDRLKNKWSNRNVTCQFKQGIICEEKHQTCTYLHKRHSIRNKKQKLTSWRFCFVVCITRCSHFALWYNFTKILQAETGFVKCPWVEFQSNYSKDDNCEQHQQSDLQKGCHGLDDWFQDHLQTYKT